MAILGAIVGDAVRVCGLGEGSSSERKGVNEGDETGIDRGRKRDVYMLRDGTK